MLQVKLVGPRRVPVGSEGGIWEEPRGSRYPQKEKDKKLVTTDKTKAVFRAPTNFVRQLYMEFFIFTDCTCYS